MPKEYPKKHLFCALSSSYQLVLTLHCTRDTRAAALVLILNALKTDILKNRYPSDH